LIRISSSSPVHGSLRMDGSSWLCHRSRHCLPVRPLSREPMSPPGKEKKVR